MPDISFSVTGPSINSVASITVSDANTQRIITYLMNDPTYGKVTEANGTVRDATAQEATQAFARGIMRGLLDQTVRYEKDLAAKSAYDAVTGIDPE